VKQTYSKSYKAEIRESRGVGEATPDLAVSPLFDNTVLPFQNTAESKNEWLL